MLITAAILAATLAASLTDWLFMDVLVHRFYAARPDIWRVGGGAGRIIVSQAVGTLATAVVVILCAWMPARPFVVAGLVWAAGALPIQVQSMQWMRVQPEVVASHAAGWLVRVMLAAATYSVIVQR